jgi:putative membrane protein insertion efficiency factor
MTAKLLLFVIRAYQLVASPILGGACRFHPSCSAYAREAIELHGAARGSWLALRRIARCHPFGGHGVDAVPPLAPR